MTSRLFIGTAGWGIPRLARHLFSADGTHLQRYADVLPCVEINSSFHRPHSAATYARWAASTPASFRFAVKMPRAITHDLKLRRARAPLDRFLEQTAGLGRKRGPLLVQMPPSHAFDTRVVSRFFDILRRVYTGPVVCEPRHESWFSKASEALLTRYSVARVAADPPLGPGAADPGGWNGMVYFRLHGSPRVYWSRYGAEYLDMLQRRVIRASSSAETWCVFDNTAGGAAVEQACELLQRTGRMPG